MMRLQKQLCFIGSVTCGHHPVSTIKSFIVFKQRYKLCYDILVHKVFYPIVVDEWSTLKAFIYHAPSIPEHRVFDIHFNFFIAF